MAIQQRDKLAKDFRHHTQFRVSYRTARLSCKKVTEESPCASAPSSSLCLACLPEDEGKRFMRYGGRIFCPAEKRVREMAKTVNKKGFDKV